MRVLEARRCQIVSVLDTPLDVAQVAIGGMLACTRDVAHATVFDCPDTGRDMTDRHEPWRGDMPLDAAVGSPGHYRQPDRDDSASARRFHGNKDNAEGAYTTMHLRSMWDSATGLEHPEADLAKIGCRLRR